MTNRVRRMIHKCLNVMRMGEFDIKVFELTPSMTVAVKEIHHMNDDEWNRTKNYIAKAGYTVVVGQDYILLEVK